MDCCTRGRVVHIYAERGQEKLYAGAEGRTTEIARDIDTLYGQLLRRMKDPALAARYVVAVPTVAVNPALRVPAWVREQLHVDVIEVDDTGEVPAQLGDR